ncbi:LacI family DNA-binding transcriptional regulator [Shewanella intestini]|uniref:LacI family transcriptional regulator n=1 Tax=Shewanella intestini TaxID=2017544 RepID=A0ABS5I4N5_9GAMM|nr:MULTISPECIES: LacI family DNA-binding transcriptional regulator [Shewanella]MBR9728987.1 LacI family transcriptional regulator [Shewanella intestini]MRG36947.1 LacI family DNA-binding transcriptional regulator [Shewanella sp. XMDDZSB0408]
MVDPKRARLKDVAQRAGVSMMTVSRVLNQDDKVSAKTREKVLSIANSMGYRPNVSARRLASNKSFFIGLLYDNPSQAYISQFLLSALHSCRSKGYHLIVEKADDDIENTLISIKQLIDETQMDGMILLPPVCDDKAILSYLKQVNMPFVRIAPDSDLTLSPYICMDDYQAAFDVTEQLIQAGHSRIAHIIGDLKQGVSRLRYQGFLDALRSNQITVAPEYIINGSFTYQSGMQASAALLDLPLRPTAIFAANDEMAAAAISVAQSRGLNVPNDVAVVGFDDTQLATIVWPHITTVKQPIDDMAHVAISVLTADEPYDGTHSQARHVLDFEIVHRGSSLTK